MNDIESSILDRVRQRVADASRYWVDASHAGVEPWPVLRRDFSVFEFLRLRRAGRDYVDAERHRLAEGLALPARDTRAIWAKEKDAGLRLLEGSQDLYIVEYGDPSCPAGVPPKGPAEGLRFVTDLARDRLLVVADRVELSVEASFRSVVSATRRRALADVEPVLRALAAHASVVDFASARMILDDPGWPGMLLGDRIWEVAGVDEIPQSFVEYLIKDTERSERVEDPSLGPTFRRRRELYSRLRGTSVFRAWYDEPPRRSSLSVVLWLAPERQLAVAESWGVVACGPHDETTRIVLPYGSQDPATIARYAKIEAEAVADLQRGHVRELLGREPRLESTVARVSSEGYTCWRCGTVSRDPRQINADDEGDEAEVRCAKCRAWVVLRPPTFGIPTDISLEGRLSLHGRECACGHEMGEVRVIRRQPGAGWSAVCPKCGCTSPA